MNKSIASYLIEVDREVDHIQLATNRPLPRQVRRALAKIYQFRDRALQNPKSA